MLPGCIQALLQDSKVRGVLCAEPVEHVDVTEPALQWAVEASTQAGPGGPAAGGLPRPADPQSPPPETWEAQAGGGPALRHHQGQPSAAGEGVGHPEAPGTDNQQRHPRAGEISMLFPGV